MGQKLESGNKNKMEYMKLYSLFEDQLRSKIETENTNYIVLMRHGDRQDCSDIPQSIPNEDDPELSSIGIEQAKDIGYQLKLLLLGIKFSEINIFSSPFTRTLMTGINVTNAFDINNNIKKNIYVIKDLAENGVKDGYENNKEKSPIYYFREKEYKTLFEKFVGKYIKNKKYEWINFDFKPKVKEIEDEIEITDRFTSVGENLYNFIINKNQNKGNSLDLFVTHQYGVSFMIPKLFSFLKNEVKLTDKNDFFFCCSYCFKITKEKTFHYLGQLKPSILRNNPFVIKDEKGKIIDPTKRNNRYLIVTRHGERIDSSKYSKNKELPNSDPELTINGITQALSIGIQLRNLLFYEYNNEINEINIFTSPSIRTMMTGITIAGAFDYRDNVEKQIRVITDLNETSVKNGFSANKIESPIYYHKNTDKEFEKLYNKYIMNLIKNRNYRFGNTDFTSLLGTEEFEDPNNMIKRAQNVINNIKEYIETAFIQDTNTLSIVSTHQLNVSMIIEYLFDKINESNKIDGKPLIDKSIMGNVGYCCSLCFKIDGNNNFSFLGKLEPNINDNFEYELKK